MTILEACDFVRTELDQLTVSGVDNVQHLSRAAEMLSAMHVKFAEIIKLAEAKEQERAIADLAKRKEERAKQLEEAAARGETIVGGQTVRLNADGTADVIIE